MEEQPLAVAESKTTVLLEGAVGFSACTNRNKYCLVDERFVPEHGLAAPEGLLHLAVVDDDHAGNRCPHLLSEIERTGETNKRIRTMAAAE